MALPQKPDPGLLFSGAVMTQAPPRSSKARHGSAKTGGPPPHHVLMELKQRILAALGKLADRDTQQIAVEELDKILETISTDSVSVCLSCLYDSDMQQKSVVKKECVRLFGSLASLHGDLLVPHLPKVIASIMRRLRDPDSSVREACVDAMGVLSARMLSSPAAGGQENGMQVAGALTLATFSKPLFDALSEQNKSVQTGAAMCLARVIESAKNPPLGAMARLCPRICKFMSNPNFLARPALLAVIGSLSQVGAFGQQHLTLLMPCIHEALENSDWATRKAAAETLSRIGSNLGSAVVCFKSTTLPMLEACRFDKVKPVRDSVHDATQLWKNLPGDESESVGSATKADSFELGVAVQNLELQTPSPVPKEVTHETTGSPANANTPDLTASSSPSRLFKQSSEKPLAATKKRAPALTDKKINPGFFQKLELRDADDWQIEVAVPRNCPPSTSTAQDMDQEGVDGIPSDGSLTHKQRLLSKGGQLPHDEKMHSQNNHVVPDGRGREPETLLHNGGLPGEPYSVDANSVLSSHGHKKSTLRQEEAPIGLDKNQSWGATGHITSSSSNGTCEESQSMNGRANWHFIHKQLSQLENQQSSLMQMVEDFMASSQETMFALQARVRGLERMVEDLTRDQNFPSGRRINGAIGGYESGGLRPSGKYFLGHDYVNSKFGKGVDGRHLVTDRISASDTMATGIRGARESTYRSSEVDPEDWDGYVYGTSRGGQAGMYMMDGQVGPRRNNVVGSGDLTRIGREDLGTDQTVTRRVWDTVQGSVRLGEGPSARSVWQASKDEATLAAIRVAGEDAGVAEVEGLSAGASRLVTPESGSESLSYKNGGQGTGQYWTLWGSAMEFVHAGDMESAYVEVLSSEDEHMLVRMMSRTGPVLDQLSSSTVIEMLHAIGQLLQQQSYFDFSIAWIQQAADMVVNSGPDCLALSLDAKKELLLSLQDSASMDMPEGWLGNSVDQLLQQLANAWSIDLMQAGAEL